MGARGDGEEDCEDAQSQERTSENYYLVKKRKTISYFSQSSFTQAMKACVCVCVNVRVFKYIYMVCECLHVHMHTCIHSHVHPCMYFFWLCDCFEGA